MLAMELPPSTKLTDYEVMEVLSSIFGIKCHEYREIITFLESKRSVYEAEPIINTQDGLSDFTALFSKHLQFTMHVRTKEASGYGMLSSFALFVCGSLSEKFPENNFKIDPQFYVCKGKQYSSDEALIILTVRGPKTVLVVWEYKPKVSGSLEDVPGWRLCETILQAFYLQKQHTYPILHCLTDLQDFHYFSFNHDGQALELLKYIYLKSDLSQETDTLHHLNFLCHSTIIATRGNGM